MSFSAQQQSTFPTENELLAPQYLALNQQVQQRANALLPYQLQEAQQKVGDAEMDVMGRASLGLLGLPDEAARAAAYPGVVADLQRMGFAKNAPAQYPGEAALHGLVSRAVPVGQQYQYGMVSDPAAVARLQQLYGSGTPGASPGGGSGVGGIVVGGGTPFVAKNLPPGVSPEEDQIVRTVLGEAAGQPLTGQQGVAAVIKNRMAATGKGAADVIFAPSQFEPWNTARRSQLEGYDPNSPQYQAVLNNVVRPIMSGQVQDPTGGATHFYAPALMAQRGQGEGPSWAAGQAPTVTIGGHRFYKLGGGGTQTASTAPSGAPSAAAPTTPAIQQGGAPPAPPGGAPGAAASPSVSLGDAMRTPNPSQPQFTVAPPAPGQRADVGAIMQGVQQAQASPLVRGTGLEAGPSSAVATVAAPAAATPEAGWGTGGATSYSDSPTIPQNQLAPKPPAAAAPAPQAPAPQQAQPPIGSRANLPRAADVPSGMQSPQIQQAQALLARAALIGQAAAQQPNNKQVQDTAAAMIADLKARAAVYQQADSVVQTQEGQLHTLTGKIDDPTKPLADYHETSPGSGIWVGGPGTEPRFQPPGRLVVTPGGDVYQTTTGGAVLLKHTDPAAVAALEEARASGAATGTAVAKQLPEIMATARNAAAQEGQIDYASRQLQEAAKGGIPSGYFSDGLAVAAAAAKSLGLTGALKAVGVDPEAVGNVQTAQKTLSVIGGAILRQALGPGSAITDGKIEAFIHTQPGIETDPQALQRIMAWARSQYTYERELGQAAVAEAAKPENQGRLPPHWLPGYYRDHGFAPIFDPGTSEMRQPDGQASPRETPAASSPLPKDATGNLKEGTDTTFSNGQVWTLRNGAPVRVK